MSSDAVTMPTDEELANRARQESEAGERDREYQISRGLAAKRILEEPMLREAFQYLETEWTAKLKAISEDDVEGFRTLRTSLRILGEVERQLQHVLETGRMETIVRDDQAEVARLMREDVAENG